MRVLTNISTVKAKTIALVAAGMSFAVAVFASLSTPALAYDWCVDNPGKQPPECTQGHDIRINCYLEEVYNENNEFIGWNVNAHSSTEPPQSTNIYGEIRASGGGGDSYSNTYTQKDSYVKFVPGKISDPEPVFNFGATVNGVGHVGDARCEGGGGSGPGGPGDPPACPPALQYQVTLLPTTVRVGASSVAFPPDGWFGGSFVSADTSIATVNGSSIVAIKAGLVSITGEHWQTPEGAVNCALGGTFLTVVEPSGTITAHPNPCTIPAGQTLCSSNIQWNTKHVSSAAVYVEDAAEGSQGEQLFALSVSGSQVAPWIDEEGYIFNLYDTTSGTKTLLSSVLVKASRVPVSPPVDPPPVAPPPGGPPGGPPSGSPPSGPPRVPSAQVYNTQTGKAAGLNVACGKLLAVWQNVASPENIDGYRIYNNKLNTYVQVDNPRATQFEFTPQDPTTVYPYSVLAFKGSVEGLRTQAGSVAATWPCDSSFGGSNKDIIRVKNVNLDYNPLKEADALLTQRALPINEGDIITFAIHVVNSGFEPVRGNITVVDTMFNLDQPQNGFAPQVACNNKCSVQQSGYDTFNRRLTFTLVPSAGAELSPGEVWTLTFNAQTVSPILTSGSLFRFQNRVTINGYSSSWLQTPYVPVQRDLNVPNIYEIQ